MESVENETFVTMTDTAPSVTFIRDLYTRMLLTRLVDEYAWRLHEQGRIHVFARAYGHEAAQVGSAICIEKGTDFTLPYYRDLGVVLTIGMTPYEVFRTYLQAHQADATKPFSQPSEAGQPHAFLHWGYHKHNTVTGPAPVATQILHAAGIAFASKLRKAPVVTVAYCGDGATCEADFREGIHFAALHQLPVIFVCEQDCSSGTSTATPPSPLQDMSLPAGLSYNSIDGTDVLAVYAAMRQAMQQTRSGDGPVLLEMRVTRPGSATQNQRLLQYCADGQQPFYNHDETKDPLIRCQQLLQQADGWDDIWAKRTYLRLAAEVERALEDALRDTAGQP